GAGQRGAWRRVSSGSTAATEARPSRGSPPPPAAARPQGAGTSGPIRQRSYLGNAWAAASTSAAWPGTLTLRQLLAMRPALSIRKVERSTPMYLRPYIDFSTHTP